MDEQRRGAGRPRGQPKTGGRKKGTPNKRTAWLRDELERVNFDWAAEIAIAFKNSDSARLNFLRDLLPYLVAKAKDKDMPDTAEPASEDDETSTEELLSVVRDGSE